MNATEQRRGALHAVVITKATGSAVVYGVYDTIAEANAICQRLRGVGCARVDVERARAADVAGQLRPQL